jgi:aspartokinase-like uncharacterized kinase
MLISVGRILGSFGYATGAVLEADEAAGGAVEIAGGGGFEAEEVREAAGLGGL